jgi:hypothetical protein
MIKFIVRHQPGCIEFFRSNAALGLAVFAVGWLSITTELGQTAANDNRTLVIEPSSMSIAGGKATLTIGSLQRIPGGYSGDYRINVFPYAYNNEKGKLAMVVSDDALAKLSQGKTAAITGTSTTIGKKGRTRRIDATATPVNTDCGTLKLWFLADERTMVFKPLYHFAEDPLSKTTRTNIASNSTRPVQRDH